MLAKIQTSRIITIVLKKRTFSNKATGNKDHTTGKNTKREVSLLLLLLQSKKDPRLKKTKKTNHRNTITLSNSHTKPWKKYPAVWIMSKFSSMLLKLHLLEHILLVSQTGPSLQPIVTKKFPKGLMKKCGKIRGPWLSEATLFPTIPSPPSEFRLTREAPLLEAYKVDGFGLMKSWEFGYPKDSTSGRNGACTAKVPLETHRRLPSKKNSCEMIDINLNLL